MTKLPETKAEASMRMSRAKDIERLDFCGPQVFVTIEAGVGVEKESFTVHQQVISRWSLFFRAAFESNFTEGLTKLMTFDDVEGDIFGMPVNWIYLKEIVRGDEKRVTYLNLAKLWSLGERFIMPQLQNAVMDMFTGYDDPSNEHEPARTYEDEGREKFIEAVYNFVKHVYQATSIACPLRPLCVKTVLLVTGHLKSGIAEQGT
ncbi:hypothetical protein EG329_012769 [Mollisiaceae sp. DMI_Dod_QoI]|nr:hypothetical protein EG329_012769 [Helotiales sp. DMI_Dod_QoI]